MVFGYAESISTGKKIFQSLEKGQQTKTVTTRDENDHAHFQINQYVILDIALRLSKQAVLTVIYVFMTNLDVNNDNLGIHILPGAICKMSVLENGRNPKLGFSITKLLYVINLQCWTWNVCFREWQILLSYTRNGALQRRSQNRRWLQSWMLIVTKYIVLFITFHNKQFLIPV